MLQKISLPIYYTTKVSWAYISWMSDVFIVRKEHSFAILEHQMGIEMFWIADSRSLISCCPWRVNKYPYFWFLVSPFDIISPFSSRESWEPGGKQQWFPEVPSSELVAPCWRLGAVSHPALQWLLGATQHHHGKGRNTLPHRWHRAHPGKTVWGRSHCWEWKSEEL